ncbi:MAG: pilus assembly FimT family protein [Gemmatimonadales bacterium]
MTVIEMVMAFVIVGIMTAFAFPRVRDAVQRENVRSARALFSSYHAQARYTAILRRTVDTLHLDRLPEIGITAAKVVPVGGNVLDTLSRDDFYARYKVTVTVEPSGRRWLVFDPRGIGTEADNTLIRFSKGNFKDSLMITPTGRIR